MSPALAGGFFITGPPGKRSFPTLNTSDSMKGWKSFAFLLPVTGGEALPGKTESRPGFRPRAGLTDWARSGTRRWQFLPLIRVVWRSIWQRDGFCPGRAPVPRPAAGSGEGKGQVLGPRACAHGWGGRGIGAVGSVLATVPSQSPILTFFSLKTPCLLSALESS